MHSSALAAAGFALVLAAAASAQELPAGEEPGSDAPRSPAERGEYIVHHVAMCIYCHTPRDERGEIDSRRLLQGAPMPVRSPFEKQTWAFQAPPIAGLPGGWSDEEMVHFLQTRERPRGPAPSPPMPPFRMNEEDAQAVAAYLRSLRKR